MQFLDASTLITIAIAVGILLYLRSILGQHTGHDKPDDFFKDVGKRKSDEENGPVADNVVKLPSRDGQAPVDAKDPKIEEIDTLAKPRTNLNKGLKAILASDSSFSPKEFLSGANMAYEMIVNAFADGDKRALNNLLAKDVYESFESVIDGRAVRGETVKSSFVGIDKSEIKAAELNEKEARLTIRFESQVVTATFDKEGTLVEGDDQEVVRMKDIWTFIRDTRSRNPNWKLAATESED